MHNNDDDGVPYIFFCFTSHFTTNNKMKHNIVVVVVYLDVCEWVDLYKQLVPTYTRKEN